MSPETPITLRSPSLWLVFAIAVACFANSIFNGFVYDDTVIIRDNPLVRGGLDLQAIFSTNYWNNFPDRDTLYRPLTMLSFALEAAIFGTSPLVVHTVNVLLNGATAVVLCLLLQAITGLPLFALGASLLWATMPLHSEVVANGVGRAELLAALLSLCGMAVYVQMVRGLRLVPIDPLRETIADTEPAEWTLGETADKTESARPEVDKRPGQTATGLAAACCFFFLSVISKESAVVWPAVLFLTEWLLLEYGKPQKLFTAIPRYLCFALPCIGYLVLRDSVVGMSPPHGHILFSGGTTADRVLFSLQTLLNYFHQFVFPTGLIAEYGDFLNPPRPTLSQAGPVSTLFAWAAIAVLCGFAYRRGALVPVAGVLWYLVSIFPTSNLIVPIGTIRADRLVFFPSIGFAMCAAWGVGQLAKRNRSAALGVLFTAVAAQSYVAFFQNLVWRDKEALWSHTVAYNPNAPSAWLNLAGVLDEDGKPEQAIAGYLRSQSLMAGLGFSDKPSSLALAKMYTRSGNIEAAIEQYRAVLREDPRHIISLLSLGQLLLRKEETSEQALEVFTEASQLYSQNFHVWAHRAEALRKLGRLDEALKDIDQALTLEQSWSYVWAIRSAILFQLGRKDEAEEADQKAKRIPAKSPPTVR